MQRKNLRSELNSENKIGVGGFGEVYHLAIPESEIDAYGLRTKIASIFPQGAKEGFYHLAIKVTQNDGKEAEILKEQEINKRILSFMATTPQTNLAPAIYDAKEKLLISAFIKAPQLTSSYNLQDFLTGVANSPYYLPYDNTAKALTQFAISMKKGQDALHDAGLFHNDTATRNVVVESTDPMYTARVVDYGLSRAIGDDGTTKWDLETGPVRYMQREWLIEKKITITADLYMRRIAMLEMAGNVLGMELDQFAFLNDEGDGNIQHCMTMMYKQPYCDWQPHQFLALYLEHFQTLLNQCHKDPEQYPRAAQVQEYIDTFKDYILTLPIKLESESDKDFHLRAQIDDNNAFGEVVRATKMDNSFDAYVEAQNHKLNNQEAIKIEVAKREKALEMIDKVVDSLTNALNKAYENSKSHKQEFSKLNDLIIKLNTFKDPFYKTETIKANVAHALIDFCKQYENENKKKIHVSRSNEPLISKLVGHVNKSPGQHVLLRAVLIELKELNPNNQGFKKTDKSGQIILKDKNQAELLEIKPYKKTSFASSIFHKLKTVTKTDKEPKQTPSNTPRKIT